MRGEVGTAFDVAEVIEARSGVFTPNSYLCDSAPAEVPPDAPICKAVKRAHELVTGERPVVEGVPYGADMRLFIRFGGMPCVMYGAGDVNVAHAPDEHISITELLTAIKTVA